MSLTVAPFETRHLEAAAAIERVSFSLPWSRDMLKEELESHQTLYLAAEQGGELAGYCGMRIVLGEGYITNVATAPGYRRRGIASLLLKELMSRGRALGLSFMTLETRVSNSAAIALYEKHGFERIGIHPGYYEKPREDALIMTIIM